MTKPDITPRSLASLKRLAKAIKADKGIPHTAALELAARSAGYQNFDHAQRSFRSENHTKHPFVMGRDPRAAFRETSTSAWVSALDALDLPAGSLHNWDQLHEIRRVLDHMLRATSHYGFFPRMGGNSFEGARQSREPGCLELRGSARRVYIVRPRRLVLHRVTPALGESFFLLKLAKMFSTEIYDAERQAFDQRRGQEELLEDEAGAYHDRAAWDSGVTPAGEEVDCDTSRLVIRILGGSMMFVAKGSMWNGIGRADRGLHETASGAEIQAAIEQMLASASTAS